MNKEAERRILKAVSLLVRGEVMRILGEEHRGNIRLADWLEKRVRPGVVERLNGLALDLATGAKVELEKWQPEAIPGITQRLSVLTNRLPCNKCFKVTRVAIHDIQNGELVAVECENCCPEFRGT